MPLLLALILLLFVPSRLAFVDLHFFHPTKFQPPPSTHPKNNNFDKKPTSFSIVMDTNNFLSYSNAIEFSRVVGKLKTLKRTGWVNNNIFEPESVADHM